MRWPFAPTITSPKIRDIRLSLLVEHLEHMKNAELDTESHIADVLHSLIAIIGKGAIISYDSQGRLTKLLNDVPSGLLGDVERLKVAMNTAKKV